MKLTNYVEDWLQDTGYELGYDWSNLPEMQDLNWITKEECDASMYNRFPEYRKFKREFIKLTGGKL